MIKINKINGLYVLNDGDEKYKILLFYYISNYSLTTYFGQDK